MKSLASFLALALSGQQAAPDPAEPQGSGPRGSSQVAAGEERYDEVGYAAIGDQAGMSAIVDGVAAGNHIEVTALDSGLTILVLTIDGQVGRGRLITLSRASAAALGMASDTAGVRVRKVNPTPQDIVRLRNGEPASARVDAPPVLLTALRTKLGSSQATATPPAPRPAARHQLMVPRQAAKPQLADTRSSYQVQVATLSNGPRAQSLAKQLGGSVTPYGGLFRVLLGPFSDVASADRARADTARRGYPDARVIRLPKP